MASSTGPARGTRSGWRTSIERKKNQIQKRATARTVR